MATLNARQIAELKPLPGHIGVVAQTTQIPANFNEFIKDLVDIALHRDSELYIVDTICHDIRRRQESAQKLANKVDLMFVVGDHTSANSNRLAELCSRLTQTHLIETADGIQPEWLKGHRHIGITGGASTAEETISGVQTRLEKLTKNG
jgi:4-hydroxy-3-methylbut-2-enyl diphosphate reductase